MFFYVIIQEPLRLTPLFSSEASDVYKGQGNGLAGELGSIMVWEAEAIDWSRQKIAEVTGCPPFGQLLLVNNEEVGYAGSWSLGSAVTLIKHQPDVAAAISLLLRTFRYDVPTVYSQLGDELRHSVSICLVAVE